jgi:hypothetical protein
MSKQVAERAADGSGAVGDQPAAGRAPDRSRWPTGRSLRSAAWWHADCLAAVVTWIVGVPVALLIVHVFNRDPFTVGGSIMPIAVGAPIGAVLLVVALFRRSGVIVGVGLGAYASWFALTMAAALHGTPFGYGEMTGDQGRLVAMATKDATSWLPNDAVVPHLATEYPPLFPWLVGRASDVVNLPAWRLFHDAQIVLWTGSLLLGYLLWRRFVSPAVAFVLVALAPVVITDASKGYEFVTLVVILPWILATFAGLTRERGGMHWLPAGIIGGLIVLTYSAYLVFAGLGIVVLVALGLREAATRRVRLLHLLGVVVTAFVVASWYVVPFVVTTLTKGGNRISDLFLAPEIVLSPLGMPFLQASLLSVLEIIGLFGVVWYRRTTWWALPLLLIAASAFAYHGLFLLNTVHNDHTGYLEYTERLTGITLVAAGVLTVVETWPMVGRRVQVTPGRRAELALVAVAVLVSWTAVQGWEALMPAPRGISNVAAGCSPACPPAGAENLATRAQIEPLPDGQVPKYAPPSLVHVYPFPAQQVQQVITSVAGPNANPVVLSFDQRLFSFYADDGYVSPFRQSANTFERWDDRYAALQRLAGITDPAAFARASATTPFGPIDAFVLHANHSDGRWHFVTSVGFSPSSFDRSDFRIVRLPKSVVVAVRRPVAGS